MPFRSRSGSWFRGIPRRWNGTDVPALRLKPPFPPRRNVWINKIGSTSGFAAYVAFVPAGKTGVALLVNKSVPEPDLVSTAYRILEMLQAPGP